jgi:phytanoyl-CoA dioxygenase PhyH
MTMEAAALVALTPEQKRFFDENGYLHLPGVYQGAELDELRAEFHDLVAHPEGRPKNIAYDFMEPSEEYGVDPFNPKNVQGMMDQTLANEYWFDQFTDPRIVGAMVDLLGPDIDFHNGKVRNKPPGYVSTQSWHQDWPYERHSTPDLAAAITYLDDTDFEAGATEVLPGSHLDGEWETRADRVTIEDEKVGEGAGGVAKARAGDVVIIHVLIVHRAGHNYTRQARHAIINEYKTAQTVDQWNNRCAFAGLPLARRGRLIQPRVRAFL